MKGKLTAQREFRTIHPHWGFPHSGIWVVRDETGQWIDADQYRNDLICRFPGLILLDD